MSVALGLRLCQSLSSPLLVSCLFKTLSQLIQSDFIPSFHLHWHFAVGIECGFSSICSTFSRRHRGRCYSHKIPRCIGNIPTCGSTLLLCSFRALISFLTYKTVIARCVSAGVTVECAACSINFERLAQINYGKFNPDIKPT